MSAPFTLGNTMRLHDAAVYNWLQGLTVDYNGISGKTLLQVPILTIFASPQRAFGAIADLLVRRNWIAGADVPTQQENADHPWPVLPLPIATIERDPPIENLNGAGVAKAFNRIYVNPTTGNREIHRWPGSYTTDYHITFWCLKRYTEAYIREWLMAQFGVVGAQGNERFLHVPQPAPWGDTPQYFRMVGGEDLSNLEGADRRYIRFRVDFTLRTWMFRPPTVLSQIVLATGVDVVSPQRLNAPSTAIETFQPALTNNLFSIPWLGRQDIGRFWPVLGAASVAPGTYIPEGGVYAPERTTAGKARDRFQLQRRTRTEALPLAFTVQNPPDEAALNEGVALPNTDQYTILRVNFVYGTGYGDGTQGAIAQINVNSLDTVNSAASEAAIIPLPPTLHWQEVLQFILTKQTGYTVSVAAPPAGNPAPVSVTIADVDIRAVFDGTHVAPQQVATSGPDTLYRFASLQSEPYLIVGYLGLGAASGTVSVANDIYTPTVTTDDAVDVTSQIGFVMLVQPADSTLQVSVPSAMTLAGIYAQRYAGP